MAATKVQANWANVAHANTTITRVTQVSVNQGGALVEFAADTDHYPTVLANLMSKPSMNITSADAGTLMGIAPGTVGTATATHKDIKNASGGDIIYQLSNAVSENAQTSGSFSQPGTASLNLRAYSSDGTTNPLSFTLA